MRPQYIIVSIIMMLVILLVLLTALGLIDINYIFNIFDSTVE